MSIENLIRELQLNIRFGSGLCLLEGAKEKGGWTHIL